MLIGEVNNTLKVNAEREPFPTAVVKLALRDQGFWRKPGKWKRKGRKAITRPQLRQRRDFGALRGPTALVARTHAHKGLPGSPNGLDRNLGNRNLWT